jgi:hypothetical protein
MTVGNLNITDFFLLLAMFASLVAAGCGLLALAARDRMVKVAAAMGATGIISALLCVLSLLSAFFVALFNR